MSGWPTTSRGAFRSPGIDDKLFQKRVQSAGNAVGKACTEIEQASIHAQYGSRCEALHAKTAALYHEYAALWNEITAGKGVR